MNSPETQSRHSVQRLVGCDRIGWDAIQHKDGWWVGTDKGVTCYGDHELARAALTIIWQREGGRQLNYRIKPFTGANVQNGEHTPKLSAVDALKRYDAKAHGESAIRDSGGTPSDGINPDNAAAQTRSRAA